MVKIHISYLHIYTEQLSDMAHELLHLQDKYDVTADSEDVESLRKALEELKAVVDNLPLAKKGNE